LLIQIPTLHWLQSRSLLLAPLLLTGLPVTMILREISVAAECQWMRMIGCRRGQDRHVPLIFPMMIAGLGKLGLNLLLFPLIVKIHRGHRMMVVFLHLIFGLLVLKKVRD
jgi:hypothetical protein